MWYVDACGCQLPKASFTCSAFRGLLDTPTFELSWEAIAQLLLTVTAAFSFTGGSQRSPFTEFFRIGAELSDMPFCSTFPYACS
jgi:hypothetical protein